jgi:hypothetical protein
MPATRGPYLSNRARPALQKAYDYTLELRTEGHYNGDGERCAFIEAILRNAREQVWHSPAGFRQLKRSGKEMRCKQSDFYAVSRYQGINLRGYMHMRVEVKQKDDKWGEVVAGLLSGVAGATSGIPGATAAAVTAGFFGIAPAVAGMSCYRKG